MTKRKIANIPKLLEQRVLDLDCGFCWQFKAPLSDAGFNASWGEQNKECCVFVAITRCEVLPNVEFINHNVTFEVVIKDILDRDVYNENPNSDIDTNKWEKILYPLLDCIKDNLLNFCKVDSRLAASNVRIIPRINYNENWNGWSVSMTIRETSYFKIL